MSRSRAAAVAVVFLAMMWPIVVGKPAGADVVLCSGLPKPKTEVQALRRSVLAFDGRVTAGRARPGGSQSELISPLTFRVLRWIKGRPGTEGSGSTMVRLWDSRYARLPDRLLASYSTNLRQTFPGEIATTAGQRWRIFATNENGANFTCTGYLGSHPLRGATPQRTASNGSSWPFLPIAVGGAGAIAALALLVRKLRRREPRTG